MSRERLERLRAKQRLHDLRTKLGASQPAEERSPLDDIIRAIDTYTGAPPRAAIGAALEGRNPVTPFIEQFGKAPEDTYSAADLSAKLGLSDEALFDGEGMLERTLGAIPQAAVPYQAMKAMGTSAQDLGALGIGIGADLTNLIPVLGAGKKLLTGAKASAPAVAAASTANRTAQAGAKVVSNLKAHAPEIEAAAAALKTKAIPSQVLKPTWARSAASNILEKSSSIVGEEYRKPVQEGIDEIQRVLREMLGTDMNLSKAQLGTKSRAALADRVAKENEPISQLLNLIQESTQHIPIGERSTKAITRNIGKFDEASSSLPAGQVARMLQKDIEGLKTVDAVKKYRSSLRRFAKGKDADVKYVVRNVDARLKALEEGTIVREGKRLSKESGNQTFARQATKLISERKAADKAYKSFKEKLSALADKLGASDEGARSFIDSLDDITPEKLTDRLLSKNDSEFLSFFMKEFPAEAKDILNYQKAELLRRHTTDGMLKLPGLMGDLKNMSPELQQALFTPQQLEKIGFSRTYLESLSPNVNPSGTEFTRLFGEGVSGAKEAAKASARDYVLKRFLDSAKEGKSFGPEALVRGAKAAAKTGRRALTPADRARRLLALEHHANQRPKVDNRMRRKSVGE